MSGQGGSGPLAAPQGADGVALEALWEEDPPREGPLRGGSMPASLRERYGGQLSVRLEPSRPTVIANFVSTVDGVVALDTRGETGGSEISGSAKADRFVMSLVRALADAVLLGSGTVRAAPSHRWTPDHVNRADAAALAAWRSALGLAPNPTTVIVTASGRVDPAHPGLSDPAVPVVLATTREGAQRAAGSGLGDHVEIAELGDRTVSPAAIAAALAERGVRLVLCEGGPHLMAQLAEAGLVDELFLTLSPQIVGRSPATQRLALLEGTALAPGGSWGRLQSVRRAGDHLFLRYRLGG